MNRIFVVFGEFITDDPVRPTRVDIASFKSRSDAAMFAWGENHKMQADVLEVEEITCVDDYGFPVSRLEYAELRA